MKFSSKIGATALTLTAAALLSLPAQAKFETGATLPDLQVTDSNGVVHNLSDFDGKNVVLEWTNHQCPYVKKHYDSEYQNMQGLQKRAAANDVVWLSVISSGEGLQGYVSGEEANALSVERGATPTAVLMDAEGTTGHIFSAKTTPHMFVINKERTLVYQGAIDSNRSANPNDIPNSVNYVEAALNSLQAGEPVATGQTNPYRAQYNRDLKAHKAATKSKTKKKTYGS